MDYIGNEIANTYWEYKKPVKKMPNNPSPEDRIKFAIEKYVKKLYTDPKGCNPV